MGSTFSSLNAGLTGLYAAQRLIEVSGQNINNMNTPGYTRQRVEQRALGIGSEPSVFAGSVPQGGGVEITRIRRLDDFFLDAKLRLETGRAAGTKETSAAWKGIESAMDELGRMSVSDSMRTFFKSWGDVNNNSDNRGARASTLGAAEALVTNIKTGYTHINDLWKNGREQLDALVADLNTTMDSVQKLNDRIRKTTVSGGNASGAVNHLKDERDQLIMHISKLTGATVRQGYSVYTKENAPHPSMIGQAYEDGTVEVMLGGNSLVGKDYVNHFEVEGARDMAGIDAAPRDKYKAAVDALKAGGKNTDTTFEYHGQIIQKYQAHVQRYEVGDKILNPDGSTKTLKSGDPEVGTKYVAFYDMEDVQKGTKKLKEAKVEKTEQGFTEFTFMKDEGPARLRWELGGHVVAIEDGTIGGLMQNLKPAQFPGVSGTIGSGGAWAETGKLYNDLATNLADEINGIHANNIAEGGTNNTKTLVTKETKFYKVDLTKPVNDRDRMQELTGETLKRIDFKTEEAYDTAVKQKVAKLEKDHQGSAIVYENVKEDGGDFFKFAATDNKLPAAMRLSVAVKDPQMIAAGQYINGVYDGSVSLALGNRQDAPTSAMNEWSKSVVDIGVHAKGADDKHTLAEQTRQIAEQQQKSQSSVDMNEEVINLIQGQHAYAGAARIMSTVNSMLEALINIGR
ncbi:flagellar hook-associated protein FlgK [Mobiluncus curtisii]|uniref:flagellar hook-associated protein FlgK n=1 Tax=Mobiluncus curtisii TaxID=2051 RepID=UPI0014700DC1|nr:flagellar basal body rod C-terminal domain-containing protein [Mobiluncus curtisii]NMW45736.1 flagellar biosynthesis protein FlgK [Mobiluncus curtisii]NMW99280.1 flagellar biosynthesis protein FlgK [Mobiluncus curtisii]